MCEICPCLPQRIGTVQRANQNVYTKNINHCTCWDLQVRLRKHGQQLPDLEGRRTDAPFLFRAGRSTSWRSWHHHGCPKNLPAAHEMMAPLQTETFQRWGRKRNLTTSWETQRGEVYLRSWVFLRVINRSRSYGETRHENEQVLR